jgi:glycosyltransferase involved in cell wall biosynthesis
MPIHEIPGQMAQADLGIYPALPDPHMDIATPSKVLEFAVMGLPVVASRIKVLEGLFGDDAIMFFTPGDASDFADCVLQLHANSARRTELVRNADRVFVHVHRWIDEEDRYLRLLGDITGTATTVVTGDEAEIKERRKSRKS